LPIYFSQWKTLSKHSNERKKDLQTTPSKYWGQDDDGGRSCRVFPALYSMCDPVLDWNVRHCIGANSLLQVLVLLGLGLGLCFGLGLGLGLGLGFVLLFSFLPFSILFISLVLSCLDLPVMCCVVLYCIALPCLLLFCVVFCSLVLPVSSCLILS
jgi:hypothetical protein